MITAIYYKQKLLASREYTRKFSGTIAAHFVITINNKNYQVVISGLGTTGTASYSRTALIGRMKKLYKYLEPLSQPTEHPTKQELDFIVGNIQNNQCTLAQIKRKRIKLIKSSCNL